MTASSKRSIPASASSEQYTPSPFPAGSRYEIRRQTTPIHALWATAIVAQSQVYKSPVFSEVYTPSAAQFDLWLSKHLPFIENYISPTWSLNLGVFDLEHEYSSEKAREADGKFFWNEWPDEESKKRELENMTLDEVVKRMDFPLVAVALSYDGFATYDMTAAEEFKKALPEVGYLLGEFGKRDLRDVGSWKPTAMGQLLKRNATSTKLGYEGAGLTKKLTYYMMDEARREGFQSVIVNSAHPGVTHIWMNAPSPCSAHVIAAFESDGVKDGDGKLIFKGIKHTMSRIVVDLN